jgi:c-di-GMP-binding flagellar brake protein YcgR
MEEKRKHKRLDIDVNVELERLDQDGVTTLKYLRVDVADISRSGMAFVTDRELEMNSYFDTKIQIWTKEIVEAVIEVVRKEEEGNGAYKYGCIFVGMTDPDALKIDIYQIFNDL